MDAEIDDQEIHLWFTQESWEDPWLKMRNQFDQISLEKLIIEIVEIFLCGHPNYKRFLGLLGSNSTSRIHNQQTIYSLVDININRKNNDIKEIELHIDTEELFICKLKLYINAPMDFFEIQQQKYLVEQEIVMEVKNNKLIIFLNDSVIEVIIN
ncbi:hypothetical protein QCD85_16130 [Paenibacillus sp. PsM32]|uniref:hypothetical protein n=1 Tax=Paenibacillus sp. PsM32 TaxID=3030536 RepID=UPI00263A92CD|nr:hypothetical protein [Paenibacillus sp. PsM32]MDN4619638.1 hypothetical protein [Paenibacillus sp. PsM32]